MPDIEELRESFKRVNNGSDPLQKEYDLVREAKLLNIPLDIYRRLYELSFEEPIPIYPNFEFDKLWKVLPDWYIWLIKLPNKTRCALVCNLINQAIKQGIFLSLLAAIIQYLVTCGSRQKQAHDQQKQAHYQAWQIIRSASDKSVSGGRIEALQDLAKDDISLANLSARSAYLVNIKLENSDLGQADFYNSNLEKANLSKTILINANLEGANLFQANLSRANLFQANLSRANLKKANLSQSNLNWATLNGANFTQTNLSRAFLNDVNLSGNKLYGANLQEADLNGAILKDTELCGTVTNWGDRNQKAVKKWECADFRKAKNLTPAQVKTAINWQQAHYSSDFRQQLGLPPE